MTRGAAVKLTITAGHGQPVNPLHRYDTGAVWPLGAQHPDFTEAELMADLRNRVADILRNMGHEVRTDGDGRVNRALAAAIGLIAGSDLAVELHTNSHDNPAATGVEVVAPLSRKVVAQRIAKAIAAALGLRVRGEGGWIDQAQTARGKLGFIGAGGLIVETFFLSNAIDRAAYLSSQDRVAAAIAGAMVA